MHGKFRLLSPGKVSSHSTALPSFCFFLSAVCVFFYIAEAVRPTLLRQTDVYGIFNVRTNWVLAAVRMKGGQAQTSLHKKSLRRTEKTVLLPHQGIKTRVFRFEFQL